MDLASHDQAPWTDGCLNSWVLLHMGQLSKTPMRLPLVRHCHKAQDDWSFAELGLLNKGELRAAGSVR